MNNTLKLAIFGTLAASAILALASSSNSQESCCGAMAAIQHDEHHGQKPLRAKLVKGVQKATVIIDGGYKPSAIEVQVGKPVEITFKLGAKPGCGNVVVIQDLKFRKELQPGKVEVVKFTPKKEGQIGFECGMGMLKGKIVVTL